MLRSTSVKNDLWSPVKLLARQSFDGSAIASSSLFVDMLIGKTIQEAKEITDKQIATV